MGGFLWANDWYCTKPWNHEFQETSPLLSSKNFRSHITPGWHLNFFLPKKNKNIIPFLKKSDSNIFRDIFLSGTKKLKKAIETKGCQVGTCPISVGWTNQKMQKPIVIRHTVHGSGNLEKNNGINYQPQLVSRISEPSTVCLWNFGLNTSRSCFFFWLQLTEFLRGPFESAQKNWKKYQSENLSWKHFFVQKTIS